MACPTSTKPIKWGKEILTINNVLLSLPRERKNQERARCTLRARTDCSSSYWSAGLASLKQVLDPPKGAVLSRCIC